MLIKQSITGLRQVEPDFEPEQGSLIGAADKI